MLGGGQLDGSSILSEGVSEKLALETFLIEGGFGYEPISMFVG
jgi:hypothetical protein